MAHPLLILALPAVFCAGDAVSSPTSPEPSSPAIAHASAAADSLAQVYAGGETWDEFYGGVDRRQELWVRTWTSAVIPAELAARALNVGGPWRILVIAEPGCSDSVNSVPYIAKLVEMTPGLEMRLVNSTAGRPWMEAHRSADGRASTPTVLVLDEAYRIRGCWVEQPLELQAIWLPVVARGTMADEVGAKMAWYQQDEGRAILREFVEVLEGASSGDVVCPGL